MNTAENRALWDERAKLGATAGTQDLLLKQLEQRAILEAIQWRTWFADDSVLEVGSGTGETALLVAQHVDGACVIGIDSSPGMVSVANERYEHHATPWFAVGDAMAPPVGPFDVVYSQRCLINLPSWEAQKQAIDAIANVLVPGGRYLMVEHSQDGLDAINEARGTVDLKPIERPWHNANYFTDAQIATVTSLRLVECIPFSAPYYFLSRVLNAKLSADRGQEPAYDAPINQLALRLPADCVNPRFAQARLWIWEKPA